MNPIHAWLLAAGAAALAPICLAADAASTRAANHTANHTADRSTDWPRWHGRLSLGHSATALRLGPATPQAPVQSLPQLSLMGDYYLTRSGWGFTDSGGFRATSGLVLGHGAATLLSLGAAPSRQALSVQQQRLGLAPARAAATSAYLGLGYTGFSRGGWGFSADVGLLSRGGTARLGREAGSANLDDSVRELRLAPLVQLGVSYAF